MKLTHVFALVCGNPVSCKIYCLENQEIPNRVMDSFVKVVLYEQCLNDDFLSVL